MAPRRRPVSGSVTAKGAVPAALTIRVHLLRAGRGVLRCVEEEGVLGAPRELDLLTGGEQPGPARVLGEDLQLLTPGHPHEVLRADTDEAHVADHAAGNGVARGVELVALPSDEDLLGPDPYPALVPVGVRAVGRDRH